MTGTDVETYGNAGEGDDPGSFRVNRTALTEKLLANARETLNDVASITGLPVHDVAKRYADLFEDRGWMTERQEERFLLIELGDLIADAKVRLKNADDDHYAGIARIVLNGFSQLANRFDARKKLVEEDINQITRAHGKQFGAAFDVALNHVIQGLKSLHPDITDEEVSALHREGLGLAKVRLEKVTIK